MDYKQAVRHLLHHRSKLIGYAWSIVRDEHVAEDLYQDICISALGKIDEIEDEDHLRGWLRRALRYEAFKVIRRDRNGPNLLEPAVLDAMDEVWDEELAAESKETMEQLANCLDRLPPRARRLIDVRYGEGLSGQALAKRVGRSLNAVYVGLTRSHRALRDCMKRHAARAMKEGLA